MTYPSRPAAAESMGRLLTGLEAREGILDRRFYAICEHSRADELRGLLSRAGLGVFPLSGQALRLLLLASALGGSPTSATKTPSWRWKSTAAISAWEAT